MRISDCPAAVNSIMAPKHKRYEALLDDVHAIEQLFEKALGSGGKSEDQPLSVTCQTTLDVRE